MQSSCQLFHLLAGFSTVDDDDDKEDEEEDTPVSNGSLLVAAVVLIEEEEEEEEEMRPDESLANRDISERVYENLIMNKCEFIEFI
ncbi:MAG TPA: hypothetical protein PKX17_06710 [Candidatus Methanomethylicus sp.]|nr:hypothetical protein [Candidatus Methanomethylicus sp.]